MARYENTSGGIYILPDGTEIKAGESADVSDDVAGVPGVAQWIESGKFQREKPKSKAKD